MILSDTELYKCIYDFCVLLLDSNRGDPPYLNVIDSDIEFLKKYSKVFETINDDFFSEEHYSMRHIADNAFQNHIRKSLNSGVFPYLTLSEQNSDSDICNLLTAYSRRLKIAFPKCFIAIARHLRTKSVDLENAKVYVDFAYGQKEDERDTKLQLSYNKSMNAIRSVSVSVKNEIEDLVKAQEEKMKNAEKKSTETSITILGIFSAVVLTFNAGVSFSSVVIHSFIESSIYRAVLITSLFGIILGNAILGLFAYLEFVRKSSSGTGKVSFTKSKTFVVMLVMNIISVGLIVADVAYYLGWIPLQ